MTSAGEATVRRVLLVREWEQQLSSSGCCGRIEGDFLRAGPGGDTRAFAERRRGMQRAGRLYRALRERYGDRVEVCVVDPRNLLALVPMILRDARRHDRSLLEMARALLRISVTMVVVDGRVIARNRWPDPEEVFGAVEEGTPASAETPGGRSTRTPARTPTGAATGRPSQPSAERSSCAPSEAPPAGSGSSRAPS